MIARSHTAARPAGVTLETMDNGSVVERDTLQCVHCGMHWQVIPGSGRHRGWCQSCGGPACGKQQCMATCYPMEKRLEDMERA